MNLKIWTNLQLIEELSEIDACISCKHWNTLYAITDAECKVKASPKIPVAYDDLLVPINTGPLYACDKYQKHSNNKVIYRRIDFLQRKLTKLSAAQIKDINNEHI